MKMSPGNCHVTRSGPYGDLHVEPERVASSRAVESGRCRTYQQSPSRGGPADQRPAGPPVATAIETGGAAALSHRTRGRPSPRRLPTAVRDKVIRLMNTLYVGFNDTHLTEKLREEHGLVLSRESVRRIRRQGGQPALRARRAPARPPARAGGGAGRPRADRRQSLRLARDTRPAVDALGRGRRRHHHAFSATVHTPRPASGGRAGQRPVPYPPGPNR